MESHLTDIRSNTALKRLDALQASIIDCAKNIKSNDAVFKISTLPSVTEKLKNLMDEYGAIYQDVEADQKAFLQVYEEVALIDEDGDESEDYIETQIFKNKFEDIAKKEKKKLSKTHINEAKKKLKAVISPEDEDVQFEAPARQIPKDPITKKDIRIAVKSTVCNHIYDKEGIEEYFTQKEKAKKKNIQCPVAGCLNRSMARSEIVLDEETNNFIQSL